MLLPVSYLGTERKAGVARRQLCRLGGCLGVGRGRGTSVFKSCRAETRGSDVGGTAREDLLARLNDIRSPPRKGHWHDRAAPFTLRYYQL